MNLLRSPFRSSYLTTGLRQSLITGFLQAVCCGLLLLPGCRGEVPDPQATPAASTSAQAAADSPVVTETPAKPVASKDGATKDRAEEAASVVPVPALEAASEDGHNQLSRELLEQGWLRLFDGHTLFGWQPQGGSQWSVQDGVIVAPDSDVKGLLTTTTRWADYELKVDFRVAPEGNSGIFLRTPADPKNPAVDCYELNVCDSHPQFKSASLVARAQPTETVTANGEWHTFHVQVAGPKVTAAMDGKELLTYEDTTEAPLTSGFIGLQMNGGKAEFRNIYLRPLSLSDLLDGSSLAGWRTVPGSTGTFEPQDGTIVVKGGANRGFLESEQTAANFVLQFEAVSHGDALNSGVFFRTIEGTEKNPSDGYEFQIQNGVKNGDRNQPADFGTGAIFRRTAARRVVSSDHQWFTATLVADGPHFTTWIDGTQVVDWTDDRAANDNPRQGLRLAAGHLSLQSHDPTTDLQFRRLKLVELPSAR